MREIAPAHALPDQRDLRLRLDRHLHLDLLDDADDLRPRELREGRPTVAQDPRVAVLVGPDRSREAHVGEGRSEDVVGARIARILEVVLDAVERRARLRVLHLEAWDDEGPCAVPGKDACDRPLGRHEGKARVVEDVGRVEEHDARHAGLLRPFEEHVAASAVLLRRDRDRRQHLAQTSATRPGERFRPRGRLHSGREQGLHRVRHSRRHGRGALRRQRRPEQGLHALARGDHCGRERFL